MTSGSRPGKAASRTTNRGGGRRNGAACVLRLLVVNDCGHFSARLRASTWRCFRPDAGFRAADDAQSPGFAAAILTLGLESVCRKNSLIFSVVNAVLSKPCLTNTGGPPGGLAATMGTLDQRFLPQTPTTPAANRRSLTGLVEYHNLNFPSCCVARAERWRPEVVFRNSSMFSASSRSSGALFRPED